jgi:hypothetical protein
MIVRDAADNLLAVRGQDPATVLVAYCEAGPPADRLEPVELAWTDPGEAAMRWGIFRSGAEPAVLRAIAIRRTPDGESWVAGDGLQPIPRVSADTVGLGAHRAAVSRTEPAGPGL